MIVHPTAPKYDPIGEKKASAEDTNSISLDQTDKEYKITKGPVKLAPTTVLASKADEAAGENNSTDTSVLDKFDTSETGKNNEIEDESIIENALHTVSANQ